MVLCDNFCTDERGRAGFDQYKSVCSTYEYTEDFPSWGTGRPEELNTYFISEDNLTVATLMRECIVRHLNIVPTA